MTALLLFGDTERSPALRHELPLAIGDPLLFVESGERRIVLTSHLEKLVELQRDRSYDYSGRTNAGEARFTSGELKPVLARTFPLAEAQAAHDALQRNEVVGKVVLVV